MEFVLIGQPNSGKSTIFNEVAGYKTVASNFPGVTVKFVQSEIDIDSRHVKLTDLPGTYSLQASDEAENVTSMYLYNLNPDAVIINVLDASVLSRSLELTLQLMELEKPMVIALNMIDEAEKKGIKISEKFLSEKLGIPIVKTIGRKGIGVFELFAAAAEAIENNTRTNQFLFTPDLEKEFETFVSIWDNLSINTNYSKRFLAIKFYEKDPIILSLIEEISGENGFKKLSNCILKYEKKNGKSSEQVISSFRHSLSFELFEETSAVESVKKDDIRKKIDDILMHPVFGFLSMALILYSVFILIFSFGNMTEPLFLSYFAKLDDYIKNLLGSESLMFSVISGAFSGFGGGIAIVIPFLLPFFVMLSILEDTGYLARIAYLIDNIMHKIGLHGLSIVPIILGYGCTVPGILATRILKSKRDKIITATLTTLVPCTARMAVIFGLVGFFISLKAAVFIYVISLVLLGITGKIMSKIMPEVSPGLILEIPKYHLPSFKAIAAKTWFRLKEFVFVAWPILIAGSIILEIIKFLNWENPINNFAEPFTSGILGLPAVVGVTLIFGIMRKELALLLLFSALGTSNVIAVMTEAQIYGFTIFVTFYIPCLATFAALGRELNWRNAVLITIITFIIAVILSVISSKTYSIFF